mgnify:CR=1 FL=1
MPHIPSGDSAETRPHPNHPSPPHPPQLKETKDSLAKERERSRVSDSELAGAKSQVRSLTEELSRLKEQYLVKQSEAGTATAKVTAMESQLHDLRHGQQMWSSLFMTTSNVDAGAFGQFMRASRAGGSSEGEAGGGGSAPQ